MSLDTKKYQITYTAYSDLPSPIMDKATGKHGFAMFDTGEIVGEIKYSKTWPFDVKFNLALVANEIGRLGMVNLECKEIIPTAFDQMKEYPTKVAGVFFGTTDAEIYFNPKSGKVIGVSSKKNVIKGIFGHAKK
jgi:hypothetical protein